VVDSICELEENVVAISPKVDKKVGSSTGLNQLKNLSSIYH
jgi:hypothetical protein